MKRPESQRFGPSVGRVVPLLVEAGEPLDLLIQRLKFRDSPFASCDWIIPGLQRVQIGEQVAELLLGDGIAQGRHHPSAAHDALSDEAVVGRQAAGQIRFSEQPLQPRPLQPRGGIGLVARGAISLVHTPAESLASRPDAGQATS